MKISKLRVGTRWSCDKLNKLRSTPQAVTLYCVVFNICHRLANTNHICRLSRITNPGFIDLILARPPEGHLRILGVFGGIWGNWRGPKPTSDDNWGDASQPLDC